MIFYSIETVDGARISSSLEQPTQDELDELAGRWLERDVDGNPIGELVVVERVGRGIGA